MNFVFDSNLSGHVTLSQEEEDLLGEIFFSLDHAREHLAVQQCLRDIYNQGFKVRNTLNAYTLFGKIWSYATTERTNFHSPHTVYHAKQAYLAQTGVLGDLVKECNLYRRDGGKNQTLPSANAFDDSVATATTMTAQFDTAPTAQYSVCASSEVPLTFTSDFSNIPSSSSSGPNPDLLPAFPLSPPDVGPAGVWGDHHDPLLSSGTMYPGLNDAYYMQPAAQNEYSGNQLADAGPSQLALQHHHGGSVQTQYQNDFGGSYGVQDVQLYNNQLYTSYGLGLEQNQEEDHYGDVYELH